MSDTADTRPARAMPSLANTVIDARNAQPAKLKTWLRDNQAGHRFTDSTSATQLRILVARRQIRLAKKSPRNNPNATMAISLKQFKKHLAELVMRGAGPKEHLTFNAKLVVIDSAMTILRHSDDCRGVVKGGVCTKCKESTIGEPNFCITCTLQDLSDSNELYQMTGYKVSTCHGTSARAFSEQTEPEP